LVALQELALKGYSDLFAMGDYFDPETGNPTDWHTGDSLEWFMAIEIAETYDPDNSTEDQLGEAIRVLTRGVADLQGAINKLQRG